ncbi:MAG: PilN domain-containing protein [Candidatus Nanopelagicales bacterium]|jgi:Tfp pilus assembly protein PilN|nr:PilN domain-containing protein [Actinomycetota bacterium]HNL50523.1 PilN domain-containing protein [Actinomycetota bacterium]HNO14709.1 PilN domain-containing protein [Actinomycetota bacterium]HUM86138.1 PilN domain-containing protein [Actinomycetota bacterium]
MTTSYSATPPTGSEEPPSGPDQQPLVQVAAGGLDALLDRRDFPTPDLIPPAILLRRQVQRSKRMVLFALLAVVALLAGLFVIGRVQLASATAELATAQQRLRDAEAEKAKYAEVPAVYAAVDAARAELAQAMGNEVQVARLVANLAAIMPPSVSLTQVSMIIGPEDEADTVAKATDEAVAPLVGTVTFSGEAATFNDVSLWIETLRNNPDYQNVILTDVSRDDTNGVYLFTNTAELTDQALSGRYVEADE